MVAHVAAILTEQEVRAEVDQARRRVGGATSPLLGVPRLVCATPTVALSTVMSGSQDLLINEIGNYNGVVPTDQDILAITADGDWSIGPR